MLVGLLIAPASSPPALNLAAVLHVRPAAPAAHQRGDLRVRGQRVLLRRLLLDAAPAQGAHVLGPPEQIHFWGWQAIIVLRRDHAAARLHAGKEYAELEWPIDILIAVVWVIFAVNFFGTIARARAPLYVAIWFYIASIVTVALLHIFNNLVIPAGRSRATRSTPASGRVHAVVVRPQRRSRSC
jgi:hypothetical protein